MTEPTAPEPEAASEAAPDAAPEPAPEQAPVAGLPSPTEPVASAPAAPPARAPSSLLGRAVEYVTLGYAASVARSTATSVRAAVAPELALGRQKHEAAEALWSTGNYAEAIRLAREALEATVGALTRSSGNAGGLREPGGAGGSEVEHRLVATGTSSSRAAFVRRVLQTARDASLPVLDADVSPMHDDLQRDFLAARLVVDGVVRVVTLRPRDVLMQRAARVLVVVITLAVVTAAAVIALRPPPLVTVTCSAHWNNVSDSDAPNVIDQDPDTEWSLPDRTQGWLELRLNPPHSVDKLRILNGRNRPWDDRGANALRVEVMASGRPPKRLSTSFPQWKPEPTWQDLAIATPNVERIRIYVDTWHRAGGSIAEVEVH